MTELNGKVALVTGASRGIGRAIARQLADSGAAVGVNFNSSAGPAAELQDEIRSKGGRAVAIQADVSRPEELQAMLDTVAKELGQVDILVNNAGFVRDRLLLRMSEEDWDAVWAADYLGAATLARSVLPTMEARSWGRIINIASVVGVAGNAGQANYATAKGAIIGFTKDLAVDAAGKGVTVNCVAPGYINTDATAFMDQQHRDAWLEQIPMGRWGDAIEIAAVVSFLASHGASYITGQCLVVDGGLLLSRK